MPDPEHMVRPKYPKKSLKAGIEGHVELPVLVGNNGKTLEVTVGKGKPVFATPALEAIRKWQFHPVLIGGKPVETVYKIQVRFVLILQKAVTGWEIESPQETAEVASSASTDPKRDTPDGPVDRVSEIGGVVARKRGLCARTRILSNVDLQSCSKHCPGAALVIFSFRHCGIDFAKAPLHRCSDSHPRRDGLVVFPGAGSAGLWPRLP